MQSLKGLGRSIRKAVQRAPWRIVPRIAPMRDIPDRSQLAIDVKDLIASLDHDEMRAHADAYFAPMTISSPQCRKPFMNPAESVHLCSQLGLLFDAAALFGDADVLDFGCGTGWLSIALAHLGCRATGLDISPAAVKLAQRVAERELANSEGSANFVVYDGKRLPFDDATFDRIVCFDAFHHVVDQRSTMAEFARVLRPGGRIAFVEPGPHHSTTPQSQQEMLQFRVIENDISMSDMARFAAENELTPPEMLVQLPRPVRMPIDQFTRWTTQGVGGEEARRVVHSLVSGMTDGQCFYVCRGHERRDSRQMDGLRASLTLLEAIEDTERRAMCFRMSVRNDGHAHWLCAPRRYGQVRLVVSKIAADGRVLQLAFAAFPLPTEEVAPGASIEVSGQVQLSANPTAEYSLRFDLVASKVAWFAQLWPNGVLDWSPVAATRG